ncbi:MAG: hypothetical protein JWL62_419, partial [Hyphomicrobiales bacterium]|nr:hypothetical protein [Hyphomicrobiales bacterium]
RALLRLLVTSATDQALGDNDMGPGDTVAEDIQLTPLPDPVLIERPSFAGLQYFVSDGIAVLVHTGTRTVVKVLHADVPPSASGP